MANTLGRGLSSLIPQKAQKGGQIKNGEAVVDITSPFEKNRVVEIPVGEISPNPLQPRRRFAPADMDDLVESIKSYGIIQPLIVTRAGIGYELIAGERRWRAAKIIGLKTVPAIIREVSEQMKLEMALVENIQRQDLNPIELAIAYRKLIDEFNLNQEELAIRLGKSRPVITNTLRLLNLPEEIQAALIDGRITEGHAKTIVGLESEAKQLALFKKILLNKMTIEDAMKETRIMGGTKMARIKINYADKDKEFAFRQFFGTKAEIKRKGKGGEVIIYFYSDEELGEMVNKVKKQ